MDAVLVDFLDSTTWEDSASVRFHNKFMAVSPDDVAQLQHFSNSSPTPHNTPLIYCYLSKMYRGFYKSSTTSKVHLGDKAGTNWGKDYPIGKVFLAPAVVEAPVIDVPVIDAPVVEAPVIDAPVVEALAVDVPVNTVDAPASDASMEVEAFAVESIAVDVPVNTVDAPASMEVPVDYDAPDLIDDSPNVIDLSMDEASDVIDLSMEEDEPTKRVRIDLSLEESEEESEVEDDEESIYEPEEEEDDIQRRELVKSDAVKDVQLINQLVFGMFGRKGDFKKRFDVVGGLDAAYMEYLKKLMPWNRDLDSWSIKELTQRSANARQQHARKYDDLSQAFTLTGGRFATWEGIRNRFCSQIETLAAKLTTLNTKFLLKEVEEVKAMH